ncbi:hypothetical protein VN97_g1366 [Penicillium thymicola]|uniref:Uncharacterized protein n=1 Tax=Penicillium thymicola TaxID=293382 RepID=A0AAI9TR75_PENTH|nr:hypothetical protein VN97_g1366 [Penicillium thymicola]
MYRLIIYPRHTACWRRGSMVSEECISSGLVVTVEDNGSSCFRSAKYQKQGPPDHISQTHRLLVPGKYGVRGCIPGSLGYCRLVEVG